MNKYTALLTLLLLSIKVNAQHEYLNHPIDVLSYNVAIELNDSTDQIKGREIITFDYILPLDTFFIDLQNLEDGKGMQISGHVLVDGQAVNYDHHDNRIWVYPGKEIETGKHELTVQYEGVPRTGLIIGTNKFDERTFFGDNWPNRAHHWFACVDHPSDKATIDFTVIAPVHYECIATGNFISREIINNGTNVRYAFKSSILLPTKVMVIGVADFVTKLYNSDLGFDVSGWAYPQNAVEGISDMLVSVEVLNYFIEIIGDFPFEKLANVQSTTQFGGMENAGNIFYDENAITGEGTMEALIAHEIAHQWFGNSASEEDWCHLWLSEGFATYLTDMYWEQKYGTDAMNERLKSERIRVLRFAQNYAHPVVDRDYENLMNLLNPNSYQKGAWVLHMLRNKIGDEAFLKGLKIYYDRYKFSNATTDDFRAVMEETSGQNLQGFFKQWLKTAGHPVLLVQSDIKRNKAEIVIEQKQASEPFEFDFEIEVLYNNGTSEVITIPVKDMKTTYTFEADTKITGYRMDPNVKLLYEEVEY